MRKKIIDFNASSQGLVKLALEYKEKKQYERAAELLKRAVYNHDCPQAFIEYAKLLSLYNWSYPTMLLARGMIFFPDNAEIRTHLVFVAMMQRDSAAIKFYTDYGRNITAELHSLDKLFPEYEEALSSDGFIYTDESEYDDIPDTEFEAELLDVPFKPVPNREFKVVTDFDQWLSEQDDSVKDLIKPDWTYYSLDAIELYINKKLEMKLEFSEQERSALGNALDSCVFYEGKVTDEIDDTASLMLKAYPFWEVPLFIKGRLGIRKTEENKALALSIFESYINGKNYNEDQDLTGHIIAFCVAQGLYENVCDFYEKYLDRKAGYSAGIECGYAEAAFMTGKYEQAEKTLMGLNCLDPFDLSFYVNLIYTRLLKDDEAKWSKLKPYFSNGFGTPKYASLKVFEEVAAACSQSERVKLAAIMLKNPEKLSPEFAREVYRCRLIASDAWMLEEKYSALRKLAEDPDCYNIVFSYERIAYCFNIKKRPKLIKVFSHFAEFCANTGLPITDNTVVIVTDILDDMYDRLVHYDLMPQKMTEKWIKTAVLVVLEKMGLRNEEISSLLKQFGISEKSYSRFKEALYN